MKLFLIRHAESEHNVKRAFAGVTDSTLTEHGALQIGRLAQHFRSQGLEFSKIFSSNLQRAKMTAEALQPVSSQKQSPPNNKPARTLVLVEALREKNFGSLEGQSWASHSKRVHVHSAGDQESQSSMELRARAFLDENILPLLADDRTKEETVAVVSHGIILSVIWRCLSNLFRPQDIHNNARADKIGGIPAWSNTGYLELDIKQLTISPRSPYSPEGSETTYPNKYSQERPSTTAPSLRGWQMSILTVNGQHHVSTLKRTRGGVGSSRHDKRQKQIDTFFIKPKASD